MYIPYIYSPVGSPEIELEFNSNNPSIGYLMLKDVKLSMTQMATSYFDYEIANKNGKTIIHKTFSTKSAQEVFEYLAEGITGALEE